MSAELTVPETYLGQQLLSIKMSRTTQSCEWGNQLTHKTSPHLSHNYLFG